MKRGFTKRIIAGILVGILSLGCAMGHMMPQTKAATFEEINQSTVFLKQPSGSKTCTLVAATMMVRRAAMLNGNVNWAAITEDVMQSAAWVTGTGLKWEFKHSDISVKHADFSGNPGDLAVLLSQHPEGIVLYKQKSDQNHAVLVTDYTDGVFYCADPSPGAAVGRIPMSEATITIEASNYIWYVDSPELFLTDASGNIISHETVDVNTVPGATASPVPSATIKPSAIPKPTATPKPTMVTTEETTKVEVKAPKKVTQFKVKNNKKKTLTTSWKKVSDAKGYQLLYGQDKTFAGCASISQSKKKCKITDLKKGKVYYVKVRAYKLDGDERVYGKCSKVKKVKVKK